MKKLYLLGLCSLFMVLFNCAREPRQEQDGPEKRYLEAYNQAIYNGSLTSTASGLYYIEQIPGTGTIKPQDEQFAFIQYTKFSMNGTILETIDSNLSRQLGQYADSIYYGPRITGIGAGLSNTYLGVGEVLKGMTAGGEAKFIIPSWLSPLYEGGARQLQSPIIMHVKLIEPVPDIEQWQTDTLRRFSDKHFSHLNLDTLSYDFYCTVNSADTAQSSDTLDILYVGYLLDGFVFDTNIRDTAVKHKIYSADKTYAPMSVVKSDMSFVEGFKKALNHMGDGDKAYTFFSFWDGYGTDGKEPKIPAFSPLCFYIELKIRRSESGSED